MDERGHRAGSLSERVDPAVGLGLGIEVARVEIRRRIREVERAVGSEAIVGAVRRIARIEDDVALGVGRTRPGQPCRRPGDAPTTLGAQRHLRSVHLKVVVVVGIDGEDQVLVADPGAVGGAAGQGDDSVQVARGEAPRERGVWRRGGGVGVRRCRRTGVGAADDGPGRGQLGRRARVVRAPGPGGRRWRLQNRWD